jgi:2-keto-myo-inositol isomerase
MKVAQLAINSVSTGGDNFEERLSSYSEAGFTNVEFHLAQVKEYLAKGRSPGDVRELLETRALRCIGGFEGCVRSFGDEKELAANEEQVANNARLLAEMGGTVLVVGTDGPPQPAADPLERIADRFAAVARRVAPFGISLAIEFNWGPVVRSLRSAAEVARRSGQPNVGVLFDPAHYHCTPTKLAELNATNVAFIKHVHVNDMADKPGELSHCNADRRLPGEGSLDLCELFGRIEAHGYQGWFSIEMFDERLRNMPPGRAAKILYESLLPLCTA